MNGSLPKPSPKIRKNYATPLLPWERVFGVAPSITSAVSEYDAACLIGHTDESYGKACVGRTAVTHGCDFILNGLRYQVKANRPSGRPGSFVTLVGKASNYDWDRLIWIFLIATLLFKRLGNGRLINIAQSSMILIGLRPQICVRGTALGECAS
jgi:hypothetical protein